MKIGSLVSASCETLGNAAPVKEVPYCRFDVVSSAVLPVEIGRGCGVYLREIDL